MRPIPGPGRRRWCLRPPGSGAPTLPRGVHSHRPRPRPRPLPRSYRFGRRTWCPSHRLRHRRCCRRRRRRRPWRFRIRTKCHRRHRRPRCGCCRYRDCWSGSSAGGCFPRRFVPLGRSATRSDPPRLPRLPGRRRRRRCPLLLLLPNILPGGDLPSFSFRRPPPSTAPRWCWGSGPAGSRRQNPTAWTGGGAWEGISSRRPRGRRRRRCRLPPGARPPPRIFA
mmetsp:Transcript_5337/g.13157  ORF Transcript_5337/g.13157 Transcript_5337/m.13157 type:complete len:223 (+) Transcript_5337:462-1130(+)